MKEGMEMEGMGERAENTISGGDDDVRRGAGDELTEIGNITAEQRQRPAIALFSSGDDIESVLRSIDRSKRHGYFVFVVFPASTDDVLTSVVRELGAGVLRTEWPNAAHSRQVVERAARAVGFPGLLYVQTPSTAVDFSRCRSALDGVEEFSTDAPTTDYENQPFVSVAIPAYNECTTIRNVVTSAREHADEVIVVDDGSEDGTADIARDAGATVVEHESNRGYGGALKTAFEEAAKRHTDYLVIVDGDGQHDPDYIPKLLSKQRETGAEVVIGSRFEDDVDVRAPFYRRIGLWVINLLTNLSLGVVRPRSWVSDTQSGFRAYSSTAVESLALDDSIGDQMSASTDVLYHAHRNDYAIEEVGVTIDYDEADTSSQHPVVHGFELVKNILKTIERERPLTFFGIPGFLITTFGFGFGYEAVFTYSFSGSFPVGTALLSVLCLFLGSLLSVAGILLHSLNGHVETLINRSRRGIQ